MARQADVVLDTHCIKGCDNVCPAISHFKIDLSVLMIRVGLLMTYPAVVFGDDLGGAGAGGCMV